MLEESPVPIPVLYERCTGTVLCYTGTAQHGSTTDTVENGKRAPTAPAVAIPTTNQPAPCGSIARTPVPTCTEYNKSSS